MSNDGSNSGNRRILTLVVVAIIVVVVTLALVSRRHKSTGGGTPLAATTSNARPVALPAPGDPQTVTLSWVPHPAVILEVQGPEKVRGVLKSNPWIKDVVKAPLGVGFLGSWAAFLGSKASDIGAPLEGTLADLATAELFAAPFRVVWFGGEHDPDSPVLVVPKMAGSTRVAFELLNKWAERGTVLPEPCPSDKEGVEGAKGFVVHRWLVGEHAVFAASDGDRLLLGRKPEPVAAGLCTELPAMPPVTAGRDLELAFLTETLGREAGLMTTLLGIDHAPRLAFGVEGDHFVPRGVVAAVKGAGRLDTAALPDELLKLVPADAPVMLSFQVRLPSALTTESLRQHFAGESKEALTTRQAILLWRPQGRQGPSDTLLIWSRNEDRPALNELFDGAWENVCGHPVFASQGKLLQEVNASCAGQRPSILNAAPAVIAGLREPVSMTLGIQVGQVLSKLTVDAFEAEQEKPTDDARKDISAAQLLLEQLPFIGLTGTTKAGELVPAGFRS